MTRTRRKAAGPLRARMAGTAHYKGALTLTDLQTTIGHGSSPKGNHHQGSKAARRAGGAR
jgi:hypothetical protein